VFCCGLWVFCLFLLSFLFHLYSYTYIAVYIRSYGSVLHIYVVFLLCSLFFVLVRICYECFSTLWC